LGANITDLKTVASVAEILQRESESVRHGQGYSAAMLMHRLGGNSKVIIVDDEKIIRESLAAIFRSRGYESKVALSAEQAVEIIAEWQPDLAILDVELPKTNGIDLATALKTSHPACVVLLFSGQPSTTDLLADAAAGGHSFEVMAKPVHPTVLLDKCADLLSVNPRKALEN
jgi:DNA-binding response OmpR family regulator